ncbi:serine/threonine-protein phosphatase alpha-2 isoform [Histomonas meleagridis]|uniref:serine/threonine-protein phosphatase alpha-2 isoform n=1 Tax=Histomonas meleagridis TaxID=135588 RepID=UPI0035595C08|nr:serine/threonine-protein phosphatase alpha-2 isoform [Histomonas meleagridis]KAH0801685.1 serine/threonine-protein phosphatase alpha-2 isoform [Histomonas meleagridis]
MIEVEKIIAKLWAIENEPISMPAGLTAKEIKWILKKVRKIFLEQPILLELEPPLTICGDTHGQFHDTLRIFKTGKIPPQTNYLFMGDYVDRGAQSIENVCLMFCYKILYPNNFYLLRGNHECSYINRVYGFYDDCICQFSLSIWKKFCDVFNCLPIAAIVAKKIFCIHGGISPDITDLDDIRKLKRPLEVPEEGLLCDLLWSDPSPLAEFWEPSDRGTSYYFGLKQTEDFLHKFGFELICRGHQAVMNGYDFPFYPNQSIVTVFSAPNYCYEFENKGAMLKIDENLFCSFLTLEPVIVDIDIIIERPGTPPPRICNSPENKLIQISCELKKSNN